MCDFSRHCVLDVSHQFLRFESVFVGFFMYSPIFLFVGCQQRVFTVFKFENFMHATFLLVSKVFCVLLCVYCRSVFDLQMQHGALSVLLLRNMCFCPSVLSLVQFLVVLFITKETTVLESCTII